MSSSSYKSIVKSTSLVGSANIAGIFFRIIRNKALAILIGPAGFGLIGALNSTINLIVQITGLGLDYSAVRDIAMANQSKNVSRLSETIYVMRKAIIFTGIIGTAITFFLSTLLSKFTFGDDSYSFEIKILSVIVFLNLLQAGQYALIQGMRKIKDLSKLTVWAAFTSTIFSIPIIYFFHKKGIIAYLIIVAVVNVIVSWRYARKIVLAKVKLRLSEVFQKSKGMVKLGIAFMGGALVTATGLYLIRVIIIRKMNIESVGIYQAAMTISTLYIGIILKAMGQDFYPRLSTVIENNVKSIQIINEQTEIGILIAAPGLIFTLIFAPFFIDLFYSAEFVIAYDILRWMIIGIFIRLISWPMGFVFIAKGKGKTYFFIQFILNLIHICLIYFLITTIGIVGTGLAFFLLYLLHVVGIKYLVGREIDFYWYSPLKKDITLFTIVFFCSSLILYLTNNILGEIIVTIINLLIFYYSIRRIMNIFELNSYKDVFNIVKSKFVTIKKN